MGAKCFTNTFLVCLLFFCCFFFEKMQFHILCESSARQKIHAKCLALFFLKTKLKNVTCYIFAWVFKVKHFGKYYQGFMWAAPCKKVSSSMGTMQDASHAHAKSHSGIRSPLINSIVSNDSVSGEWRPWSDFMDAQIWAFAVCISPKTLIHMGQPT